MSSTKLKSVVTLGIIAFLVISFWGLYSMPMDEHGEMANCPFMGVAAVCRMNPLEHLAAWQNMFTVPPQKIFFVFLTLLLLAFLAALLLRNFWRTREKESLSTEAVYYERTNAAPIRNPLQEAFSDGILHPKIF